MAKPRLVDQRPLDKKITYANLKLSMKKTAQRLLVVLPLIFVFSSILFFRNFNIKKTILAQETSQPEGAVANQNVQCLEVKKIGGHTVELSTKEINQFLPPGAEVYIVECLSTDAGDKCTTGEEAIDTILFGNTDDLTYLRTNYQYERVKFTGTQPMKSDIEGKIGPVTWESYTLPSTGHTFFGAQFLPEITLEGQAPTLQLSTFYFLNSSEDCASLRWDPYGRVFDSQSLEPIPNVLVTLYSKVNNLTQKVSLPMVKNPQTTLPDGIFNFVVPDGTYLLKPSIGTHSFPNIESKLHPNYTLAYSDIYRGEDITQKGGIQHKDIPIDPLTTPYRGPAKILDYSTILDKLNSKLLISGVVTHPLSRVRALSGGIFVKEVTSSKYGRFDLILDNASLDPTAEIQLDVIKTNLTTSTPLQPPAETSPPQSGLLKHLFSPVYAQGVGIIKIDPIPNNLEGYAYNAAGQVVPSSTVSIFLLSSQKPFSKIQADKNGYFNIPSQYLPPLPYYLQVKSPNGEVNTLSTREFVSLNKKFAAENSVNYGTYRPVAKTPTEIPSGIAAGQPIESSLTGVPGETVSIPPGGSTDQPGGGPSGPIDALRLKQIQTRRNILTVIALLIIFMTVLGLLALNIYQNKRKERDRKPEKKS